MRESKQFPANVASGVKRIPCHTIGSKECLPRLDVAVAIWKIGG